LFWDRVSLLIPGWPWTCNLNLPASSIWVLRLQACLTKPDILFIKGRGTYMVWYKCLLCSSVERWDLSESWRSHELHGW
jgi:hypothetical protein